MFNEKKGGGENKENSTRIRIVIFISISFGWEAFIGE
jgi:hypothetical protein